MAASFDFLNRLKHFKKCTEYKGIREGLHTNSNYNAAVSLRITIFVIFFFTVKYQYFEKIFELILCHIQPEF